MSLLEKYLSYGFNTSNDQENKHKEEIPKVDYVLKKHSKILTGKEKKILKTYSDWMKGKSKEFSINNSIKKEAENIVFYLNRV